MCPIATCLVKQCNHTWINRLSDAKNSPIYPKGQFVFMEGSLVLGAYFILKGKVKVISSNVGGKEQTVRLAGEGHMLGHSAIGLEKYSIGAVTLEESQICFIDNATLYEAFMANPKFTFEVMRLYSRELRKSEIRTKCLGLMNNEEKVILGLLYLADTYLLGSQGNQVEIDLNRQEIAQIIGTNAEQVSRVLTSLKKEGLIQTVDRTIQLPDITTLKERIRQYAYATSY
ncbi:Crp/Fnr family transcriptional regulator [Cecembia calidifontis]|uniref:CRP-like cAMP-binding protein n=1 Tax=Cecembia calidifontis TaxID=1187080 RepID=A0A4Q7PCG1_9BACT|nr:Crp/Fnr family transcriptional regulator [Cecembia calidifontis]RZS97905.1 CRP-like cAMP-binding protein [Cecembia calidifontis]